MYKAFIVDDEPWVRKTIINLGKWVDFNIELCGESDDGYVALEYIKQNKPNIVITDMKMPNMNGVKLMNEVSRIFPKIKFIIISAYQDFEYTKNAIMFNAISYILKPIDPDELNDALFKVTKLLTEEDKKSKSILNCINSKILEILDKNLEYLTLCLNTENESVLILRFEKFAKELNDYCNKSNFDIEELEIMYFQSLKSIQEVLTLNKVLKPLNPSILNSEYNFTDISNVLRCMKLDFMEAINIIFNERKNKNKLDVDKLISYIKDNYRKQSICLSSISSDFFISKEYLCKLFKEKYNINVTQYITKLRMDKAKEMLLESDSSIKFIAEYVGYSDLAYFYKLFKRQYGTSPKAFIRKNIKP